MERDCCWLMHASVDGYEHGCNESEVPACVGLCVLYLAGNNLSRIVSTDVVHTQTS